jgi:hypothetical protein
LAPFFLVMLFWMVARKKWRVMAGLTAALMGAILFALVIDPRVFMHYEAAMKEAAIGELFIPSLSGVVRALLFPTRAWVQFVPVAAGLSWAAWNYAKAKNWNWRIDGLPVMVVSVLVTPYEWFTDEAVLLPVVLYAALQVNRRGNRTGIARLAVWILAALSVILLLMAIGAVPLASGLYIWSGLAWAGWYWMGRREHGHAAREAIFAGLTSFESCREAAPAALTRSR